MGPFQTAVLEPERWEIQAWGLEQWRHWMGQRTTGTESQEMGHRLSTGHRNLTNNQLKESRSAAWQKWFRSNKDKNKKRIFRICNSNGNNTQQWTTKDTIPSPCYAQFGSVTSCTQHVLSVRFDTYFIRSGKWERSVQQGVNDLEQFVRCSYSEGLDLFTVPSGLAKWRWCNFH